MKKEWLVKTLALGIVVLFVGSGIVSGFNVNSAKESNVIKRINKLVTIDNHPPDAPWITGPGYVCPDKTFNWTFEAIDPDGDNVSYQIAWGDCTSDSWFGWYASGEEITRGHSYPSYGKFGILARAKDTHNATSEWAGIFDVIVPKNKQIISLLPLRFLERFPNILPIIRYFFKWW